MILDWTPAQFPRYASGLEKFDGTPLYERQNPAEAIHPFWGTLLYKLRKPDGEGLPDLQCLFLG